MTLRDVVEDSTPGSDEPHYGASTAKPSVAMAMRFLQWLALYVILPIVAIVLATLINVLRAGATGNGWLSLTGPSEVLLACSFSTAAQLWTLYRMAHFRDVGVDTAVLWIFVLTVGDLDGSILSASATLETFLDQGVGWKVFQSTLVLFTLVASVSVSWKRGAQ